MDPIHLIPTAEIAADALPRDRATLDAEALAELQSSIATHGLRQPIEVWRLSTPSEDGHLYGLISGLRRLTAHRTLAALRGNGDFTTIPAFLRTPATLPEAMAAMVEENEQREGITPWEKALLILNAVGEDIFDTPDAAVATLFPQMNRQKRARLRACVVVAEEMNGAISTPELISERELLRLSAAMRSGFTELIHQVLKETRGLNFQTQWTALLPTLLEAEKGLGDTPANAKSPARPRRLLHLKQGLMIRREESAYGYHLCFSGPEARKKGLMDDVMDMVERLFQPQD